MAENRPPHPPFLSDDTAPEPKKRQKAVAIGYNPDEHAVPHVVASGQGHVAEQILQIAFAHGVKVREDADLVEILSVLDIDSAIPVEAYAAVGEILSYVYRTNAQATHLRTRPPATDKDTEGGNHDE